jgi:hypothetical protein
MRSLRAEMRRHQMGRSAASVQRRGWAKGEHSSDKA